MQTKHAALIAEDLLPVGIASSLIGVSTDTLKRWEKAGRIRSIRTPTGHRRFRRGDIEALLTPSDQSA